MIVIASFICLCLKDNLGLSSINFLIHAMTGNHSASLQVLASSLRVVSAMKGNPPLHVSQSALFDPHTTQAEEDQNWPSEK